MARPLPKIAGCPRFRVLCETPTVSEVEWWDLTGPSLQSPDIHTHPVISNLALHSKSAHDGQGKGNIDRIDYNSHNSFVIFILTTNPFALWILQTPFCETRAQQDLSSEWGEGVPANQAIFHSPGSPSPTQTRTIFPGGNPQARFETGANRHPKLPRNS